MAITAGQEGRASDFINISAGAGDEGKVPKLNAEGILDGSFIKNKIEIVIFTSSGTWTKDAGLKYIVVEVVGGGGTGSAGQAPASGDQYSGFGGSGGGYAKKILTASQLGATEAVTIGAAGASCTFRVTGGTNVVGNGGADVAGVAGTATGGDLNISGQVGNGRNLEDLGGRGGLTTLGMIGAGGDGGDVSNNTFLRAGKVGKIGVVIVTEYYS